MLWDGQNGRSYELTSIAFDKSAADFILLSLTSSIHLTFNCMIQQFDNNLFSNLEVIHITQGSPVKLSYCGRHSTAGFI